MVRTHSPQSKQRGLSVFIVVARCKALTNRKKVVGRNLLRIVGAEGEANVFEGAFKRVDARALHPQTPFRAFPVQVVVAVHHFF